MRLLKYADGNEFSLTEDLTTGIPPYAILSHTWGPDTDEVSYKDLIDGTGRDKVGYKKLKFCAQQARRNALEHFWLDTCCIDKSDPIEVQRSINSMFRWYRDATRCYVYLSDVSVTRKRKRLSERPETPWLSAFRTSKWFTRGWTLQELLAPASVEFFAQDGQYLADKRSLEQQIHEITGIAVQALRDNRLSHFDIEERFKWAEKRKTKYEEDWAYCLLGIFGVFMPLNYGEGKDYAVRRLRKEINEASKHDNGNETRYGSSSLSTDGEVPPSGVFLVPYTSNPAFVGRSEILEQLKSQLRHGLPLGRDTAQSRAALYGLGGIGKTQVALAYVYWLREAYPDMFVFWVHASSAERFRQAYASIAHECQVPGQDDPKADILPLVKTWLERKEHGRWLMVIDNADDTQLFFGPPEESRSTEADGQERRLAYYVPECAHGSILITTRNKQAGLRLTKGVSPIQVTKMDNDESAQLLQARLEEHDADRGELSVLSSRLDHLPLALVQAAAFIQENSITVSEYVQLLDGTDSDFVDLLSQEFETMGRDSETPRAVTRAWMISFEQIQRQNAVASKLLSLMAFFDRQAIAPEFLSCYGEQHQDEGHGKIQLQKALGVLKAFCFVTVAKDQSLDIHRLVQLVTRKWLANKGTGKDIAEQALIIVSKQYPFGKYENWTICGSQDGQIARGALLHNAAGYLIDQGFWKEAERLQEEAVAVRSVALGWEDPLTLASMGNLALTFSIQGRWKEAESLEVQVMETRRRVLGEENPSTLTSMANLASTFSNQGRWKEAESLEVQVMETRRRVLGGEHPDTLAIMANLASTFSSQGRWKEAKDLQAMELEICSRVLGEEHPDTLTSMANLASAYRDQGQWKEAEDLQAKELEICSRVLGEEHPSTLTSMANLALTFWNQDRWKEAESLEVQVMEKRRRVLGEEHPSTLTGMANLASTYKKQGRWKEAESLEVRVIETRRRVLGEEHPSTLTSMNNLAFTWKGMGRHKDALDSIKTCYEFRQRILGLNHPRTQSTFQAMTLWLIDMERESQEGRTESVENSEA